MRREAFSPARFIVLAVSVILLSVILAGCLPGDGTSGPEKPAGFLWGIWHGWVAPISLIARAFGKEVRIYEPANVGFWYDFAYYMAIVGGFGGLSLFRRRRSR